MAAPGLVGEGAVDGDDVALGQEPVEVRLEPCAQLLRLGLAVAPIVHHIDSKLLCHRARLVHAHSTVASCPGVNVQAPTHHEHRCRSAVWDSYFTSRVQ